MPPPVTGVLKQLRSPDLSARRQAVLTLADLGSRSPAAVRALAETLKDPEPRLRIMAAAALGRIGPPAESAVLALLVTLKDEAAGDAAAEALVKIGRAAVPTLVDLMENRKSELSPRAAEVLARIGAGHPRPPTD